MGVFQSVLCDILAVRVALLAAPSKQDVASKSRHNCRLFHVKGWELPPKYKHPLDHESGHES